jgi:hypothetical protein
MALPRELSLEQRTTLVKEFIARELGQRFPYTVSMHNSRSLSGGQQPHAHIMFSLREHDGIERPKELFFKRANSQHPERGGARKSREWSLDDRSHHRLLELRESWATLANRALEHAGHEERIDHRSLKAQGIDREPEPKLGPWETEQIRRGQLSERGRKVLELRRQRALELARERARDLDPTAPADRPHSPAQVYNFEQAKTARKPARPHTPEQVQWIKASQLLPKFDELEQRLAQQLQGIEREREQLGWAKKPDGWTYGFPPTLTPARALQRARLDYEGGRLKALHDRLTAAKRAYTHASQRREQFDHTQHDRGLSRFLPRHWWSERRELNRALHQAKEWYEQSERAYQELEREYARPHHALSIRAQAIMLVDTARSLKAQRQAVMDHYVALGARHHAVALARDDLKLLAERGQDPAVPVRERERGLELADEGWVRNKVHEVRELEKEREYGRDRDRGR